MNFEENKTDSTRDILTSLENKLKQATDNQKLNNVNDNKKKEITFVQHLVYPKMDYEETGEKWLQKSNKIGVFLKIIFIQI